MAHFGSTGGRGEIVHDPHTEQAKSDRAGEAQEMHSPAAFYQ